MTSLTGYFQMLPRVMEHLGTATVEGAAATDLTISGLDLSAYTAFKVIAKLKNATASVPSISLYYNADTTATNYHSQNFTSSNTSNTGSRANDAILSSIAANALADFTADITSDVDGKPRATFSFCEGVTTGIRYRVGAHLWVTAANVTTITLSSSVASALDVGSTFSVYGIK